MIYNRRIRPWDHGTPFGAFFRNLSNEVFEEVYEFSQMKKELHRLVMMPEIPSEGGTSEAHFPAIIQGTKSQNFPRLYAWAEVELINNAYSIVEDGRNSGDDGLAINRVELIPNFGLSVGPYGQSLTSGNSTLTVLEIAPDSPVEMIFETNSNDETTPVFSGYNPMTPECKR